MAATHDRSRCLLCRATAACAPLCGCAAATGAAARPRCLLCRATAACPLFCCCDLCGRSAALFAVPRHCRLCSRLEASARAACARGAVVRGAAELSAAPAAAPVLAMLVALSRERAAPGCRASRRQAPRDREADESALCSVDEWCWGCCWGCCEPAYSCLRALRLSRLPIQGRVSAAAGAGSCSSL